MNKYSFEDLFNNGGLNRVEKVTIPKIQRDYVQGVVVLNSNKAFEVNSKGKRFIGAIFDYIISDTNDDFILDFIYGSVKDNAFYPLDGQQRLTTLFLLYWYSIVYELINVDKDKWLGGKGILSHFTYETRVSSTDFCKLLCSIKKSENLKPSELIKKNNKFHSIFELDPTIKAMLSMLDLIHSKVEDIKSKEYDKEKFTKLRKIKFYLLLLDDFNLDEELYVKMNARGKVLTDYENFKADFISWMKNEQSQSLISNEDNGRPKFINIASKLDNEWSDVVFYNHKKDFDLSFFKFICRWFLSYYLINLFNSGKQIKSNNELLNDNTLIELWKYISNQTNENIYIRFEIFKDLLDNNDLKCFNSFVNFMTNYSKYEYVQKGVKAAWSDKALDFTSSGPSTQSEIVVFAGVSLLLNSNVEISETVFNNWIRFVWNATEGTDIDSWLASASVFRDVSKVASIVSDFDIENHIGDIDENTFKSFAKAVKFEYRKYKFIDLNNDWKDLFVEAETNNFLKNDLFVLIDDNPTLDLFRVRLNNIKYIFSDNGLNYNLIPNNKHAIIRAIISHLSLVGLIDINCFDVDDKEHQLKKYLGVDSEICRQVRSYLSLQDKDSIIQNINSDLGTNSSLTSGGNIDYPSDIYLQNAHNNLVHSEILFEKLINDKLVHTIIDTNHICVRFAYGNRRSVLIEIDSDRDKLISRLSKNGFECTNSSIEDGSKKWFIGRELCLKGHSHRLNNDVSVFFKLDGSVSLSCDEEGEDVLNDFNYYDDSTDLDDKVNVILRWLNS